MEKLLTLKDQEEQIKIRICFALAANEIAEKEDKLLYIQVINPKNNLLGEREVLNFEKWNTQLQHLNKSFL